MFSKRVIHIFCLFVFFVFSSQVQALIISEVHFDPEGSDTDREWIEIFNDTSSSLDLTSVKFFEANVNHGISLFNLPNSTEKNIEANEYVVVVQDINKFKIDFPNYSGKIFKASFSLSNTGEFLALKDDGGNTLFSVNYTESDRQTVASPGGPSTTLPAGGGGSATTSNSTTSTTTATQNNTETATAPNYFYRSYWPESEKIYVKAGENRVVMQGQEVFFSPKVLDGNKKEVKNGVQYRWNFGDGYTSELREGKHIYKFSDEFVVNLQVNHNGSTEEDKVYVKVVEPKLNVAILQKEIFVGTSSLKEVVDVVEIKNENNFEINIGNLQIKDEKNKTFLLPEKLFVLPKRSVLLPPELTGFASSTEKVFLNLLTGRSVSFFEKKLLPTQTLTKSHLSGTNNINTSGVQVFTPEQFQNLLKSSSTPGLTHLPKPITKKKIDKIAVLTNNVQKPLSKIEGKVESKVSSDTTKLEFKNERSGFLLNLKNFLGI